jgi:pimeloyl-ACP methyl ester carboxylesterase
MTKYQPSKQVKTNTKDVRGLQYAVHTWGRPDAVPLFLLHGWFDTGMSFQFVADSLADEYYVIAPDWRGFGETEWARQGYWFPDYLADLDVLLDYYSEDKPARLVGHSMGGNAACLYAGTRPDRVSHLVSLDVFGLAESDPADAPRRYHKWLEQLKQPPPLSHYIDLEQLGVHINKLAPRISKERARFVAEVWSRPLSDGKYTIKADPGHKCIIPVLYRREEARSCWRNVAARTLFVFGEHSRFLKRYSDEGYQQDCQACFSNLSEEIIADAGHMLHLEQPEKLAEVLQTFLRA